MKLFFDLNFLVNGGDVKAIYTTDDLITPVIKFGVRKGFHF